MPSGKKRIVVASTREKGWKTVTGKYDRLDYRRARDVELLAYGGLEDVPDPVPLVTLDKHQIFLLVRACSIVSLLTTSVSLQNQMIIAVRRLGQETGREDAIG